MVNSLLTELAGVKLTNPTMVASGILGLTVESLGNIVRGGAGAIVTKSVGLRPREGYENPTVVQARCGLINAMGLPNPGIDEFSKEVREMGRFGVPIFLSVYGFSAEECASVAKKAVRAGADAIELNASCPHVEGTGLEVGQDPQMLAEFVRGVKAAVGKPVFVKISPNVANIVETAETAEKAGADGLTAINTVKAMAIDVETASPILSNRKGGLSGPAIKPIAVRCVYEVYDVGLPVVGCGGVTDWRDAIELLLAGATAVQIGTGIAERGCDIFGRVTEGIRKFLARKGFESVSELVGLAHKR